MATEQTLENVSLLEQSLDEPHFDDELTIVKARRVVLLEQFDAKFQRKRNWFLLGMFALAMLLGAASGLVSAYFKLREVSEEALIRLGGPTLEASEQPEPATVSEASAANNALENHLAAFPSLKKQQLNVLNLKRPVVRPRQASINTRQSVRLQSLSEEEELQRIREALLTDDLNRRAVRPRDRREQHRF